jgi:hypothetical protein
MRYGTPWEETESVSQLIFRTDMSFGFEEELAGEETVMHN